MENVTLGSILAGLNLQAGQSMREATQEDSTVVHQSGREGLTALHQAGRGCTTSVYRAEREGVTGVREAEQERTEVVHQAERAVMADIHEAGPVAMTNMHEPVSGHIASTQPAEPQVVHNGEQGPGAVQDQSAIPTQHYANIHDVYAAYAACLEAEANPTQLDLQ